MVRNVDYEPDLRRLEQLDEFVDLPGGTTDREEWWRHRRTFGSSAARG
jgi:hypothetical protein